MFRIDNAKIDAGGCSTKGKKYTASFGLQPIREHALTPAGMQSGNQQVVLIKGTMSAGAHTQ